MATISSSSVDLASDIGDVLNAAGGSVDSSKPLTFFTSSAGINKWAKYKPVSYAKVTALTDAEFKLANYGLNNSAFSTSVDPKTLMNKAIAGTDFYPYKLPTGGTSSPYRLSDFRGYNTNAQAPYSVSSSTSVSVQSFPAVLYYSLSVNGSAEFLLSDLASFENVGTDKHIAVLWTKGDGIYYLFNSAKAEEEGDSSSVDLSISVPSAGTYHLLGVFTDYSNEYGNVDVTSMAELFIPIPDSYRKVTVSQKVVYGYVSMTWSALDNLYYSVGYINGFGDSYPKFTLTFPNGSVPSCTYRLGMYLTVDLDGSEYHGTYWYEGEYISHSGGSTSSSLLMVDFPSSLQLSDILGDIYDPYVMEVRSITIRPDLERVEGQGYLTFADSMKEYNVTI